MVGIVVERDGRPAAGAEVRVVSTDTGIAGNVLLLFSLGLACMVPDTCFPGADEVARVSTDDAGAYRATLPDAYVAGTETDTDWLVTASRPPELGQVAGPSSTFEFEVNIAVQEAPPVPLWSGAPTATTSGWRTAFSAPPPPAGLDDPHITFASGANAVRVPGHAGEVDLRFLEPEATGGGVDTDVVVAAATAYADVTVRHAEGRTIYHQRVSTPAPDVGVTPSQLVPTSRRADCSYGFADGTTSSADECAVTDGRFQFGAHDPTEAQRPLSSVTVSLGSTIELADVFVRSCDASCVVEASGDGATWGALVNDVAGSRLQPALGEEPVLVATLRPPLPARFVRVSRAGLAASEVSVWPPSPPALVGPAADAAADSAADGAADVGSADDSDPPLALVIGATALVAGVGGIALGRARRRRA